MSSNGTSSSSALMPMLWRGLGIAATTYASYAFSRWLNQMYLDSVIGELKQVKALLEHEQKSRKSERSGRIRAEQELRKLQLQKASEASVTAPAASQESVTGTSPSSSSCTSATIAYPCRPIGTIQSCFSQRNGTPRQPLLVESARCRLQLASDIAASSLDGLEQYSHVWVVYIFHENTDLVRLFVGDSSRLKGKIQVPRLNGAKMGVLATRSPHRPVPVGLSVARLLSVEGNTVLLGGADIVDGSPVLDIKPYLPFCDGVPHATAPAWVAAEAEDEPLKVSSVEMVEGAEQMIHKCWEGVRRQRSLYSSPEEFISLIKEVLSRDIRSVRRRLPPSTWTEAPPSQNVYESGLPVGGYHVVLEGIDVSYDFSDDGAVLIRGAIPNVVQSVQRGLGALGEDA